MTELSLHILDVATNSLTACASKVDITVNEDILSDRLIIEIRDNGCGMDEDFLKNVTDPFVTTRKTRKVGLGISLFKMAAELTGGSFEITSKKSVGTTVNAIFILSSIDLMPVGDLGATYITLLNNELSSKTDIKLKYINGSESFIISSLELKQALMLENFSDVTTLGIIKNYINNNIEDLKKGCK